MPNTIVIEFEPCEPAPANGYQVGYRPLGSSQDFIIWPEPFQDSPAVLTVYGDPEGQTYEGWIRGDCGDGFGIKDEWETDGSPGGGESPGDSPGDETPCIGGRGLVVINNFLDSGTITAVNGIAGFEMFPPPLIAPGSRSGTHIAFTAAISFTVTGSGVMGHAVLYRNGDIIDCFPIGDPGAFSFVNTTFDACDTITLTVAPGNCPTP